MMRMLLQHMRFLVIFFLMGSYSLLSMESPLGSDAQKDFDLFIEFMATFMPALQGNNADQVQTLISSAPDGIQKFLPDFIHPLATPLNLAVKVGNENAVLFLLERDASINRYGASFNESGTPLHIAARHGRTAIARMLLAKGADANPEIPYLQTTPLHLAAFHGHFDIVVLLLNQQGSSKQDHDGNTPLDYAVDGNHTRVVQLLLQKQQDDVHKKNKKGETPLFNAKNEVMAELLCNHGAHVNVENIRGQPPLILALAKENHALAQFLMSKYDQSPIIRLDDMMFTASTVGYADIVQFLLNRGASVATTFNNGWTALHVAASAGHEAVVKILLSHPETEIEARIDHGETALDLAVINERSAVSELLIQHGTHATQHHLLFAFREARLKYHAAHTAVENIEHLEIILQINPAQETINAALLCAVGQGALPSVEKLLSSGIQPTEALLLVNRLLKNKHISSNKRSLYEMIKNLLASQLTLVKEILGRPVLKPALLKGKSYLPRDLQEKLKL